MFDGMESSFCTKTRSLYIRVAINVKDAFQNLEMTFTPRSPIALPMAKLPTTTRTTTTRTTIRGRRHAA
jgi:hypothetical protein